MEFGKPLLVFKCHICHRFVGSESFARNHSEKCLQGKGLEAGYKNVGNTEREWMEKVLFPQPVVLVERQEWLDEEVCLYGHTPPGVSSTAVSPANERSPNGRKRRRGSRALQGLGVNANGENVPLPERRCRTVQKLQEVLEVITSENDSDDSDKLYDIIDISTDTEGDEDEVEAYYEKISKPTRKRRKARKRRIKSTEDNFTNSGTKEGVADFYYNFRCKKCPTKFRSEDDYTWHMKNVHGQTEVTEIFTCPICGRMLNRRLCYQSHLKRHENAEATEVEFDLFNKWPSKIQTSGKTPTFNCKFCLIPHTSKYSFVTHMTNEHSDRDKHSKFPCPHCPLVQESMRHLVFHFKNDHKEEYYGSTIRYRAETLTKGKPKAKCDICGKMLDVWYIRRHKEALHSMENGDGDDKTEGVYSVKKPKYSDLPFKCAVKGCFSSFKNPALLKSHFILHLENNPFACPVPGCGVKCDAQCHLTRHMKLHMEKPKVACSKCGVSYSRADKLRKHVCTFDPRKLKRGPDGLLLAVNSFPRLRRLWLLSNAGNGEKLEESKPEEPTSSTAEEDENKLNDKNTKSETKENEACKGNVKVEPQDDDDSAAFPVYEMKAPGEVKLVCPEKERENNATIPKNRIKRVNLNAIIVSDPVFIETCKENPGFADLIIGIAPYGSRPYNKSRICHRKTFKCTHCSTSFNLWCALKSHKLRCKIKATQSIKKEVTSDNEAEPGDEKDGEIAPVVKLGCVICGDSFASVEHLTTHLEKDHDPDEIFRCSECGEVYPTEESRKRHVQRIHDSKFHCTKCNSRFVTQERLEFHLLRHEMDKNFKKQKNNICLTCGKELVNSVSMIRHMQLIHGIQPPPKPTPPPSKRKLLALKKIKRDKSLKKSISRKKPLHRKKQLKTPKHKKQKKTNQETDNKITIKMEAEPELQILPDENDFYFDEYAIVKEEGVKEEVVKEEDCKEY